MNTQIYQASEKVIYKKNFIFGVITLTKKLFTFS